MRGLRTAERRCLVSIYQISALYPTKRTNFFCSPRLIRIFPTLLLCVSRKPGWMLQYRTAHYITFCGSQCRINREIARWLDVLLHQWEVLYRCNCVKEDVLFRSRNALHQLQAVLFVHSRECLHSSTSTRELSFTETCWSDHRHSTKTPGLCFNHNWGL